ncbi:TonB-dependent siderophore receptor [Pseudoalteromonas sp. CO302Y]|uniref:TonB-dependent siderophore receptor n=1 Tax=unclassified Pseudoalteromonas TaxID=194690 RepID=UPI001023CE9A|nr:TonB-dependent siderophore receptor [Pseudoalteromonas sp. CO302Y]RZG09563.1 TonB-dependent siderophore receptor [Pseudoalteromonas sp. CO133X]
MNFSLLPTATAVSIALLSNSAFAAEQTNKKETDLIEKITVNGKYIVNENIDTATGLGLSIRETPQSVTVFTAERIRDQDLDTIIDAVDNTVGLSSSKMDNIRNTMQSRGFNVSNYQIDGVPLSWSLAGDSGETSADVAIYERVEFVRGATGLLTGAGDPSASINLVRKRARNTDLTGYVDASIGSWNKKELTLDIANGLNDSGTVRGRVVAKVVDSESYIDLYEENKNIFYGVLETDLTPDTTLRVGASYQNSDPHGPVWGALPAYYTDGTAAEWDDSKTTALDWTRWETTHKNYFATVEHLFSNGWQLTANYNHSKYDKESRLFYVYGALDKETGAGLTGQRYFAFGSTEQDSVDVQLKGQYTLFEQSHDFVVGALYSKQTGETSTRDPDPIIGGSAWDAVPIDNFFDFQGDDIAEPNWTEEVTLQDDNDTVQKGFYAATRVSLTDAFKVIAGGRISSWERERYYYGDQQDYGDSGVFVPYFGALFDLNDQHRMYASYTEIFRPQNSLDANGEYLDPVDGKASEIGLKSAYFDERLQTSLAIFDIQQDNLAAEDPNFVPTAEQMSAYYGAEGTQSRGFEFEVMGEPVDGWNISAGYSQFKAEDADNNKVNTDSPRKQFKLFTTYQFVKQLPALTIGGGLNWQSKSYAQGTTRNVEQDAYTIVNLMARYNINESMDLQLNVNNLFDKKYYNYMTAGYYDLYRYGAPRNASLSFSYNF